MINFRGTDVHKVATIQLSVDAFFNQAEHICRYLTRCMDVKLGKVRPSSGGTTSLGLAPFAYPTAGRWRWLRSLRRGSWLQCALCPRLLRNLG